MWKVATTILKAGILILSFFSCPASISSSCSPHDEPVTPFLIGPVSPSPEELSKMSRESQISCGEYAVYFLLAYLDASKPRDPDFENALKIFCLTSSTISLARLDYQKLVNDPVQLRSALTCSLAGQRYARFPRLVFASDRKLYLNYPYPELYSVKNSSVEISSDRPTYKFYIAMLNELRAKPGTEWVLISGRYRKNPLDFERVDFEKSYNEIINTAPKKK